MTKKTLSNFFNILTMKRIIFTLAISLFSIIAYSQTTNTFDINIPNAFTPDGDGINDKFTPIVYGHKSVSLTIINRLGYTIYSNFEEDGWDGTYKNNPCEQNIYLYRIVVIDSDDKEYEYLGTVFLLRVK